MRYDIVTPPPQAGTWRLKMSNLSIKVSNSRLPNALTLYSEQCVLEAECPNQQYLLDNRLS